MRLAAKKNVTPLELPNPKIVEMPEVPEETEDGMDKDSEHDDSGIITLKLPLIIKRLAIAASFILVLSSVNFAAMAYGINTIEILKDFGSRIMAMVAGEKEEFKGITIVKDSGNKEYDSMEAFLNEEKLNSLYPTKFPDGVELSYVLVTDYMDINGNIDSKYKDITYVTNSQQISIHVRTSPHANKGFLTDDKLSVENINNIECFILNDSEFIQCNFIFNNYTYKIKTQTKKDLITIVENLKEIQ